MAYQQGAPAPVNDTGNIGWGVLGFFIPIVGLVLWLMWKDTRPKDSTMSRNGFLIGLIVNVVFYIIYFVAIGAMVAAQS